MKNQNDNKHAHVIGNVEENSTVLQMPYEVLFKEALMQSNKLLEEVMQALFDKLPDNSDRTEDFKLMDGTKCWIKKFSPPEKRGEEWSYGFDVKFEDGRPLSHLEFLVKCSGWERGLVAPSQE